MVFFTYTELLHVTNPPKSSICSIILIPHSSNPWCLGDMDLSSIFRTHPSKIVIYIILFVTLLTVEKPTWEDGIPF